MVCGACVCAHVCVVRVYVCSARMHACVGVDVKLHWRDVIVRDIRRLGLDALNWYHIAQD